MAARLISVFQDPKFVAFAQKGLPTLFQIAELESQRCGKIGMEVGSLRERVIIALLIRYFSWENIKIGAITEAGTDVSVFGIPISIKTITKNTVQKPSFAGVKAVWTVDSGAIGRFLESYQPRDAIILVRIHSKGGLGGFHFIPLQVHEEVFERFGWQKFFKVPPKNTNPRGVEFNKDALAAMALHPASVNFPICWTRSAQQHDIYYRWIKAWEDVSDKGLMSLQPSLF